MQKLGLILLSFTFISVLNAENSAEVIFRQANDAYMQKDYVKALDLYEQIAHDNFKSVDLYYNLGNAYYRQNNLAKALLWYERALRLDPSNGDVKANIAFVNAQTVDQMEVLPELFFKRWSVAFCNMFSLNTWAVISIILCFLFFAALAYFMVSNNMSVRLKMLFLDICFFICLIVSISCALVQKKHLNFHDEAIITALSVTVKSTPDESGTDLFTVHEGMKVKIIDSVGDWMEVTFPNGNKAWILKRQAEVI